MKFKSLSALLALSAASLSYAGGMLDAPKEAAAKLPVMTLGYKSTSIDLDSKASERGIEDPDAQTGYTVGLTVPLVGPWSTGVHFTGYSRDDQDLEEAGSVIGKYEGAITSLAYHVGYDLPFGVMDNLSLTGKLIAEDVSYQVSLASEIEDTIEDEVDARFAVGFGLSGQYFMDAFGLEVGLSYVDVQGVRALASSAFSWNVSLAYKLS